LRKKLEALNKAVVQKDYDKVGPLAQQVISALETSSDSAKKSLMLEFKALTWKTVPVLMEMSTMNDAKTVGMAFFEILHPLISSGTDPDLTRLQYRIARCNYNLMDYKACEEQLLTLLPIYEKNERKQFDDQELEDVERCITTVLLALDKDKEALKMAQNSYKRLNAASYAGPQHWRSLDMLHLVAVSLFSLEKRDEAKKSLDLIKPAVFINLKQPSFGIPFLKLACDVAELYAKMKERQSALEITELVYQTTKSGGKDQALGQNIAIKSWFLLGELYFKAGKQAEAYSTFETVFKKYSEVFGEKSFDAMLARVRMIALDKTPQVDMVKNILELLNKAEQLRPGDADVLNTHQEVAQWLMEMGRFEEGCALALDLKEKYKQRFGQQIAHRVQCIVNWAEEIKRLRDIFCMVLGNGSSD